MQLEALFNVCTAGFIVCLNFRRLLLQLIQKFETKGSYKWIFPNLAALHPYYTVTVSKTNKNFGRQ